MAHTIEAAKSGRASCRTCKQPIGKGELRLGEEVENQFSQGEMTYNWHHLQCAAKKKPAVLKQALETTDVPVENKDELMGIIEVSGKTEKPTTLPFAEYAPTSRSSCISCGEKIEKGQLRVAVETEVNTGMFTRKGPGYLHPGCVAEHADEDPEQLFWKISANSLNLAEKDLQALEEQMDF